MHNKCICKLCGNSFSNKEMSEEHYPAKSVGNNDIVLFDIVKMLDNLMSQKFYENISTKVSQQGKLEYIIDKNFEKCIAKNLYPNGRTSRTLCKECNQFLGKYDETYLKFFNADGNPKIVNGFSKKTKLQIIKAIYAKFLSVPEALNEKFDFTDFIRDTESDTYNGKWNLYFIKRNHTTDLMGLKDISTGREIFDKGIVYELSDDKFIFNLMNFEKHSLIDMTNIFEILNKNYRLVEGIGENGSYHESIFLSRMFSEIPTEQELNYLTILNILI